MTVTFSDEIAARTKAAWAFAREIAAHQGGGAGKWFGLGHLIAALPEPEPEANVTEEYVIENEPINIGDTIAILNCDDDSVSSTIIDSVKINNHIIPSIQIPLQSIPHYAANENGYWARREKKVHGERPDDLQLWVYLEYPPGYHDPIPSNKYQQLANHWLRPSPEMANAAAKRRAGKVQGHSPEELNIKRKRNYYLARTRHIKRVEDAELRRSGAQ